MTQGKKRLSILCINILIWKVMINNKLVLGKKTPTRSQEEKF